ncbi:cysteine proteinase inhibitor 6-like [Cicer arietinum]|uniref:Cysteine proteinase inhibitor 7 n=1 Tax=Cicer arietinum TaxID=3827 RepID=A0A1S2YD39_CICAR|nr:putative cysteine proteinase inhibitor 7 [Cicer arietinum]
MMKVQIQSLGVLMVVLLASTTTANIILPSVFLPIKDVNNPKLADLGNFAVVEHVKQTGKDQLKFEKILKAEYYFPDDVHQFYLIFSATNASGISNQYDALVNENESNHSIKLVAFETYVH